MQENNTEWEIIGPDVSIVGIPSYEAISENKMIQRYENNINKKIL